MVKKFSSPGNDSGKKVLLPLFWLREKGSVSIETVMVMPVITGMMLLWVFFLSSMSFQLKLQYHLQDGITKSVEAISYLDCPGEDETWRGFLSRGVAAVVLDAIDSKDWKVSQVDGGRKGMFGMVHEKQDAVCISYNYDLLLPLLFCEVKIPVRQIVYQKYYNGCSLLEAINKDYVYISTHGEVYHRQRNCPAIKRSISYCLSKDLAAQRSVKGAKYYACEVCGNEQEDGYYTTEYGERYHAALTCPNLERRVYLVEKDMVNERNECKLCRGMAKK